MLCNNNYSDTSRYLVMLNKEDWLLNMKSSCSWERGRETVGGESETIGEKVRDSLLDKEFDLNFIFSNLIELESCSSKKKLFLSLR